MSGLLFSTATLAFEVLPLAVVRGPGPLTLADLVSESNLTPAIRRELEAINLGERPAVGDSMQMSRNRVVSTLKELRSKVSDASRLWKIPEVVTIENHGQPFHREAVEAALRQAWASLCTDCQWIFHSLSLPQVEKEMRGQSWQLLAPAAPRRSVFNVEVVFSKPGVGERNYWITGRITIQREVPVVTRAINAGERLAAADVKWQWHDVTTATDTCPGRDAIVGRRLARSLRAQDIIWHQSLASEKALHRGDEVEVTYRRPGWHLSLQATAEQDGQIGDRVRVKNQNSKAILMGVVKAKGVVVVE